MINIPKYPKIENLFVRDGVTHKMTQVLKLPEFGLIPFWHVTEKIDGTNVRVTWNPAGAAGIILSPDHDPAVEGLVTFGGRTDDAQMSVALLTRLQETFTVPRVLKAFPDLTDACVTLFGEGYGGKIQSGGKYRPDVSFRLFDVLVHDGGYGPSNQAIWLKPEAVEDVAKKLDVWSAPVMPTMKIYEVVDFVRHGFESRVAVQERPFNSPDPTRAEGVVCRAPHGLLTRTGRRLMFKLKHRDFDHG